MRASAGASSLRALYCVCVCACVCTCACRSVAHPLIRSLVRSRAGGIPGTPLASRFQFARAAKFEKLATPSDGSVIIVTRSELGLRPRMLAASLVQNPAALARARLAVRTGRVPKVAGSMPPARGALREGSICPSAGIHNDPQPGHVQLMFSRKGCAGGRDWAYLRE